MSVTASISVKFEEPSVPAEAYWIRLVKEPTEPEAVTFTEAAKVIDSIFDVDACAPNFVMSGIPISVDKENLKEKIRKGFSLIEYEPCKFTSESNNFIAFIYVFRSHVKEKYNLVLTNGNVLRKEKKLLPVDLLQEVNNTKYVQLDYSIDSKLYCSAEVESYSGSSITLKKKFTGFIRIKYQTKFDRVKIKVYGNGKDNDPVGCKCIAFYKGMVTDIYIDPPEVDLLAVETIGCDEERAEEEEREPLSDKDEDAIEPEDGGYDDSDYDDSSESPGSWDEESGDEEKEDVCYQRVIVVKKCDCTEDLAGIADYIDEIPCPPCPRSNCNNKTPEAAYVNWFEAKLVNLRVECGGTDEAVTDREFFKEQCCKYPEDMDPEIELPKCSTMKRTWYGPDMFSFPSFYNSGFLIARNPYNEEGVNVDRNKIELIPVQPKNSTARGIDTFVCGEDVTVQMVIPNNCCDPEFTPPIIYNEEDSASFIADESSGLIFWDGGFPSFDLKINGQGFYLDRNHTTKNVTVSSRYHRVYTHDSCGSATITITDGCTQVSGVILSTVGQWHELSPIECIYGNFLELNTPFLYKRLNGSYSTNSDTYKVDVGPFRSTFSKIERFANVGGSFWYPSRSTCADKLAQYRRECVGVYYCDPNTGLACCFDLPCPSGYTEVGHNLFWKCEPSDPPSTHPTYGTLYSFQLLGHCASRVRTFQWKC